jgi:hypothetical protein
MTSPAVSLPSFINKPEEYGLYNPSEQYIDLQWGGRSMRLPGCRDISRDPCKFQEDESDVPGTLIIKDGYTQGLDGLIPKPGSAFNWKASDAIRNMLGIDIETGIAHSTKAGRGITFVPPVIDKNTFESIKQDAERRFASHQVAWAEAEVRAYEEALDKAKRAGVSAPPPDSGYNQAVVILSEHRNRTLSQVAQVDEVISQQDAEEIAGMEALALEMAQQAAEGKNIDEKKLAADLLKKPAIRKHLQKEYSIRKRGHLPEKEPKK